MIAKHFICKTHFQRLAGQEHGLSRSLLFGEGFGSATAHPKRLKLCFCRGGVPAPHQKLMRIKKATPAAGSAVLFITRNILPETCDLLHMPRYDCDLRNFEFHFRSSSSPLGVHAAKEVGAVHSAQWLRYLGASSCSVQRMRPSAWCRNFLQ